MARSWLGMGGKWKNHGYIWVASGKITARYGRQVAISWLGIGGKWQNHG